MLGRSWATWWAFRSARLLVVAALLALAAPVAPAMIAGSAAAAQDEASPEAEEGGISQETEETEGGDEATEREGGPVEADTLTVNVELILDASGSMAEDAAGGETKIEAAKRALSDVIAQIPEREGYNVGLRIYGQEGSNDEADKAESCQSTELIVPIDGVDRDALLDGVEAVEPTGWTPLALALNAAGGDFDGAGESVTNAVIMVTDGEETCGGDPCAVAGELNAADVQLTTHVVGFGLTPEQQAAVGCIAEEGGGELFSADDADSLSTAVFSALDQLEAVEGGYVGGNAFPLLDEGEAGELSVIAVGPYDGVYLPIVIRNNTGEDVEDIEIGATARVDGELVAAGDDNFGIQPDVVVAGGVAIGTVFFGGQELPPDAEFAFDVDADPAGDDPSGSRRDLIVEEVNADEEGIVGILRNGHEVNVGTVAVGLACFDDQGNLTGYASSVAAGTVGDPIAPGGTLTFELGIGGVTGPEGPCSVYLVAGSGSEA